MKICKAFTVCITILCCSNVRATTIRVPEDQPMIQSAIQDAANGDSAIVSPGTFRENINFIGKDIVLGSLFLITGNDDYIQKTITEPDSGSAITFSNGESHYEFKLSQSFPNPFNSQTTIQYQLNKPAKIIINIYNLLGEKIKVLVDKKQFPGEYSVIWDGCNSSGSPVSSGIYVYKMFVDSQFVKCRKMLLLQ